MNASHLVTLAALLVPAVSCSHSPGNLAAQPGGPPGSPGDALSGAWGGPHAGLSATADGATLEFDCARGSITAPVPLDAQGHFDVMGVYVAQHGGPTASDDPGVAARYAGAVSGKELTLTVTTAATGASLGSFVLSLGAPPHLVPCF